MLHLIGIIHINENGGGRMTEGPRRRPGQRDPHLLVRHAWARASKVLCWPKRRKSARAFLWEYRYKRLELAQLLGQLSVFLTLGSTRRVKGRRGSESGHIRVKQFGSQGGSEAQRRVRRGRPGGGDKAPLDAPGSSVLEFARIGMVYPGTLFHRRQRGIPMHSDGNRSQIRALRPGCGAPRRAARDHHAGDQRGELVLARGRC
jgi:hypothetical protein